MTDPQIVSLHRIRSENAIRETEKKYGDMLRRLAAFQNVPVPHRPQPRLQVNVSFF